MRSRSRLLAVHAVRLWLAAALALVAAPARAEGDSAAADALFQEAKTLVEAKKWADACPKFGASYKLDKTLGTLMNLADCEEHVDQIATAWAHWGEAVELAEKTGDKRASFASGRRAALTKRLPMIRVEIAAGADAAKSPLTVFRDEVRVDPAAYGVPLPSDPGRHVLSVRRGPEILEKREVTVSEGQTTAVAFDLVAIEKAAPPPPSPVTLVAPIGNQRVIGFAVIGVGAAALAAAGVLEILALTNKGSANSADSCVNGYCTQAGFDSVSRARTFATAGQWVGIGGIVVAAVGVTLVATTPKVVPAQRPAASAWVSGWAGADGGGLALRGVFK